VILESTHTVAFQSTKTALEPARVFDHVPLKVAVAAVHTFAYVATISHLVLVAVAVRSAARLSLEVIVAKTAVVPRAPLNDHQPSSNPCRPHPQRRVNGVLLWRCFHRNKHRWSYKIFILLNILHWQQRIIKYSYIASFLTMPIINKQN
jgi:hypothetical protein